MGRYEMPHRQYKLFVAHVMYWQRGIAEALEDCGIPASELPEIISFLSGCGYEYDEETERFSYRD